MRTSQPGRNLSFSRSKPAATAAVIFGQESSIESIWSKVGPDLDCLAFSAQKFVQRRSCSRASRSHQAVSSAALAN